ncbi:methyltransferase domain-containing protein [soil metagenome]
MSISTSSGDLIADRRFNYAAALAAAGDFAAAVGVLRQALERAEEWAEGWVTLGDWCQRLGLRSDALAAFETASRLDPQGRLGAGVRLAALGAAPSVDALQQSYFAALFDDYAPRFEHSLVGRLAYSAPARVVAALHSVRPGRFARAIDLGCGTGLMGEAIRDRVDHLTGIDVSPKMVKLAADKQVYDSLLVGDAIAHLANEAGGAFDLVLAADMLPYVGDVAPLFGAVARCLAPDGVFAFTCERHDGTGFVLGDTLRYRHAPSAIRAAAEAAGLAVRTLDEATTRTERGAPVAGLVSIVARAG